MENNQKDLNKEGNMTTQKTNEDFNKKQPDPKDPNEKKAETDPEVPNLDVKKKGNPDDLRMNKDTIKENAEKTPEFINEETAEDVEENTNSGEEEKSDPDTREKERSNKVTM